MKPLPANRAKEHHRLNDGNIADSSRIPMAKHMKREAAVVCLAIGHGHQVPLI